MHKNMSWCIIYLIVAVALWTTQVDCLVCNPRHQNIRDVPVVGYMPSLIALQQSRQRKLQLHMSDKDREDEIRRKVSADKVVMISHIEVLWHAVSSIIFLYFNTYILLRLCCSNTACHLQYGALTIF